MQLQQFHFRCRLCTVHGWCHRSLIYWAELYQSYRAFPEVHLGAQSKHFSVGSFMQLIINVTEAAAARAKLQQGIKICRSMFLKTFNGTMKRAACQTIQQLQFTSRPFQDLRDVPAQFVPIVFDMRGCCWDDCSLSYLALKDCSCFQQGLVVCLGY